MFVISHPHMYVSPLLPPAMLSSSSLPATRVLAIVTDNSVIPGSGGQREVKVRSLMEGGGDRVAGVCAWRGGVGRRAHEVS